MFLSADHPDLTYLGKLLHEMLNLSVYCLTEQQESLFLNADTARHPLFNDPADLFRKVAKQAAGLSSPVLYETNDLEQFAVVPVRYKDKQDQSFIIIGPSAHRVPNDKLYNEILNDHHILVEQWPEWKEYWHNVPYVDRLRLLHICVSANWMANQEALDITDVLQSIFEYKMPTQLKDKELELADRREFSLFHEGKEGYSQMLSQIRLGQKDELMKQLILVTKDDSNIRETKQSRIRSVKNLAIGGIALSSNAAIEGGLYKELAMSLCEMHIQHIEELKELASVETAVIAAIVDFAERVHLCRSSKVSKAVYASKEYIYLHLFEEITLAQLSEVSGLNPNYLSQRFKKETGFSVMNYIQSERIEEAKRLLDHSNDPISRIGDRLTFYDQAHFVKLFKKQTGLTPLQYRNRSLI